MAKVKLKAGVEKMQKLGVVGEFKKFILRGNVIDLAVGVIIGGAFQKIVTSVVNDVFMPFVSLITKLVAKQGIAFTDWFVALDGTNYATLKQAKAANAITLNYGNLLSNVIDFLVMAIVIFLLVKGLNKLSDIRKKEPEPAAPTEKDCPYCLSKVPLGAVRCAHCTSELPQQKQEA